MSKEKVFQKAWGTEINFLQSSFSVTVNRIFFFLLIKVPSFNESFDFFFNTLWSFLYNVKCCEKTAAVK